MAKIEAAHARLFKRIFVCKRCGAKIRADPKKIMLGEVKCRRCKGKAFRAKSKKVRK